MVDADDLVDGVDLGVGLVRVFWRVTGPYTVLLGLVGLIWGVADTLARDTWWLNAAAVFLGGLLLGWIVDLATRLVLKPLAGAFGRKPETWLGHLALGSPLCAVAIALVAYQGWI